LKEKLIYIGKIGRARGLQGEFFVSERDEPIPPTYKQIYIESSTYQAPSVAKVLFTGWHGGRATLRISIVSNREHLAPLIGAKLFVSRQSISIDRDSQYVWGDLIGVAVHDSLDSMMGEVSNIQNFGAHDVLVVCHPSNGQLMIPLVPNYVEMHEIGSAEVIRLCVPASTFEGLWAPALSQDKR
jgi:16S rRNA processing protein RimM